MVTKKILEVICFDGNVILAEYLCFFYFIDAEGRTKFCLCMDNFFSRRRQEIKKKFTKQLAILSFKVLKVRYFTTLEFGDKRDENCHQNKQVE